MFPNENKEIKKRRHEGVKAIWEQIFIKIKIKDKGGAAQKEKEKRMGAGVGGGTQD